MSGFPLQLVLTILALALVLALAWLLLRGLASMTTGRSRGGRLTLLDSLPVGTRERVVLVRLDDTEYLLGVGSGSVQRLDQIPATGSPHARRTIPAPLADRSENTETADRR